MSEHSKNSIAIKCDKLTMMFPVEKETLKKSIGAAFQSIFSTRQQIKEYTVFKDISFEVKKGEVFGIIGRNGCGKTTLLKLLSRVLVPTSGSATIYGSVASLLSVGTGFHPAYTGIENIYFNGALLGLSKKHVDEKLAGIVEFADIGDFIEQPVKTYSSGMQARLAFSVAAQLDAEIIILDEILSVGDAAFREKCMRHMQRLKSDGKTILLVSHNMGVIENFCDRAMLIKNGNLEEIGQPLAVIQSYMDSVRSDSGSYVDLPISERTDREGSGELRITDFKILNGANIEMKSPVSGEDITMVLNYELQAESMEDVDIGIAIFSETGSKLIRFGTEIIGGTFAKLQRKGELHLKIERFPFASGNYVIGFRANRGKRVLDYVPNAFELSVEAGDFFGTGVILDHSPVFYPHEWIAKK